MSASLDEVMCALAGKLEDAFSNTITPKIEVSARMEISPKSTPWVDIYPADQALRSTDAAGFGAIDGAFPFTVRARVNTTDHPAAQDALLDLLDEDSSLCVAAILQADQTLAGPDGDATASSVYVTNHSSFGIYQDVGGDGAFLGCEWTVTVIRT